MPAAIHQNTVRYVCCGFVAPTFIISFILIWKLFYVDTVNMEIISFTNTNSYSTAKQARFPFRTEKTDGAVASAAVPVKGMTFPSTGSYHELRLNMRVALLSFVQSVKSSAKYFWLLPLLLLCACVPLTVTKIISYTESFARKIVFSDTDNSSEELMDTMLSDYVLNAKGSYDSEGTVLDEDGVSTQVASVSFKQPISFQTYKVRGGDTIDGISRRFGLSNISTLIAVNDISNVRSLMSGQKLRIPSMDGILHTVAKGETLNGLSVKFNVTVEDLLDVNDLSSEVLSVGTQLFIPGARLDTNSLRRAMGELFSWPITAKWRLSSRFGTRDDPIAHVPSHHTGIDMACPTGTPIKAAMAGTVAYTGVSSVYGNYVIITHYDGYQTLYGHMSKILTKKGAVVAQGTKIGLVGSTGYSTGPHLHFTVYKNGKLIDPLTLLK